MKIFKNKLVLLLTAPTTFVTGVVALSSQSSFLIGVFAIVGLFGLYSMLYHISNKDIDIKKII